jgi:hypothetical protein
VPFDHGFELGQLVTWCDGEPARVTPQLFVLGERNREVCKAVFVGTLADGVEKLGC